MMKRYTSQKTSALKAFKIAYTFFLLVDRPFAMHLACRSSKSPCSSMIGDFQMVNDGNRV